MCPWPDTGSHFSGFPSTWTQPFTTSLPCGIGTRSQCFFLCMPITTFHTLKTKPFFGHWGSLSVLNEPSAFLLR